ncbi:hypothetical protein Tsubulata_032653 [Turnera subulata]|uniref:F-box domain-containing protein n=1 Tax=Turnera subulata TaxID=218843 RepID=A0A9Q0FTY1_9ROSI|nr:hypothetical protein Tsubulata_032653 [Turnera subulata]
MFHLKMLSNVVKRYEKLALKEALTRSYHYPEACKELSLILRETYKNLPKDLQSIIFQDTLDAFRLLPQMQTRSAASAAHLLLQSAEAALPKQKKSLAVKEFKHAKVALKRRSKVEQEGEGALELPEDILVHIFNFLDVQSLVYAGLVCRSWKFAAGSNNLWQSQYAIHFAMNSEEWPIGMLGDDNAPTLFYVKNKFPGKVASGSCHFTGNSSKSLISNRVYCCQCATIVWADNMRCSNRDCQLLSKRDQITPVSSDQVVEYLMDGSLSIMSSDSDTESEEGLFRIPKYSDW